jgi:hypothetical protein
MTMGTLLKNGDQFIGSHFAPEAFTGQNGGLNPSSIRIGEELPRSTVAKSIMAANNAKGATKPNEPDWQNRKISNAAIKMKCGMKNPNASPAKIPSKLSFGSPVSPSVAPAKTGTYKR